MVADALHRDSVAASGDCDSSVWSEVVQLPVAEKATVAVGEALCQGLPSVRAELVYADGSFEVDIYDGRADVSRFQLDRCGFALQRMPSSLKREEFYDERQVVLMHYPEVAEYVRLATGSVLVLPYQHTVRNAVKKAWEEDLPQEQRTRNLVGPASFVHSDHSRHSGWDFAFRKLVETEGEAAVQIATNGRFAILNVWRALAPVLRDPFTVADFWSLAPEDGYGPSGEWYNPKHAWYYFSRMEPGEVLIFKQFDSVDGQPGCVIHTSFEDPTSADNAPPRESVDVRCLAFFGDDQGKLPPGFGETFLAARRACAKASVKAAKGARD